MALTNCKSAILSGLAIMPRRNQDTNNVSHCLRIRTMISCIADNQPAFRALIYIFCRTSVWRSSLRSVERIIKHHIRSRARSFASHNNNRTIYSIRRPLRVLAYWGKLRIFFISLYAGITDDVRPRFQIIMAAIRFEESIKQSFYAISC